MRVRARLGLVSIALVVIAGWLWVAPAGASAPVKDGWWSAANRGVPPPVPPQVPKDGLFAANGYTGPISIAAVTWQVPVGASAQSVTFQLANDSVITSAPVACPVAPSSLNYQPAQNGPWTQRPAYDCSVARVVGTQSSGTLTFDAARLVQGNTLAMVVLAAGPADQVALDPPGTSSLTVTSGPQIPSTNPFVAGGLAVPPPTAIPASAAPGSAAPAASPGPVAAPTVASPAPNAAAPPPVTTASGPNLAQVASPTPPRSVSGTARPHRGTAWRHDSAAALLTAAIALALIAYSEGFGLLGGRIRPVGMPPARKAPPVGPGTGASD